MKRACDSVEENRGKKSQADQEALQMYEDVREYYGKVLSNTKDLKTNACCTSKAPPKAIRECLALIPQEIHERYYGCGTPIPLGIEGLHVLDLGSGSGRDCYVAAKLVGPSGSACGIDMTDEQLAVARKHVDTYCRSTLGYPNVNLSFVKGFIEFLHEAGVEDESKDLVISNCVVNLSPNKEQVLASVWQALRYGGEFYFSDVYCDRRLPTHVTKHKVLVGECLGGALYVEDFIRLCHKIGFADPRVVSRSPILVEDKELGEVLGEAKFESITYRLFKLKALETRPENYGQEALYLGTIPDHPESYPLDASYLFPTSKATPVCGNTALILDQSWLRPHFRVRGDHTCHFGLFSQPEAPSCSSGSCCS